ncbi:twin-arginine translocase TatA/TatE family subunit [Caldivirga maquilingensis]|uniref:Sec-independent protein translocase protein TatA n=1 Tax=Caldivirga maquilingensis (strain ATCC 700844 / DSM 13496 / JCM 10307 / IC-167) TaxID=397948 RepID=A8MDQ2_CALMQ|nr:twin-arginine translocase TatA/TatE family subunit [Caldivirga maquilingensis]ABW01908.1 twin-arginine translocation protein, TatA/E family subunit [Caldivirga maquilingensis IC-167]
MIGSVWDWIIVIAVVLILFGGASKIPELFRALGRAVGEFKKGQVEVERELRQLTNEPQSNQTNISKQDNTVNNKDEEAQELRRQIEELRKKIEELERKKSQN